MSDEEKQSRETTGAYRRRKTAEYRAAARKKDRPDPEDTIDMDIELINHDNIRENVMELPLNQLNDDEWRYVAAKRRQQNLARQRKEQALHKRKGGIAMVVDTVYADADTAAEQLKVAGEGFLKSIIKDCVAYSHLKGKRDDDTYNNKRLKLLNVIKAQMQIVRNMRETRKELADEVTREEAKKAALSKEDSKLLLEARAKLEGAGIKYVV